MINMIWVVPVDETYPPFWMNEDAVYALQQTAKGKKRGVWRLYANGTNNLYEITEANYNRLMAGEKME